MNRNLAFIATLLISCAGNSAFGCPCEGIKVPDPAPETSYELGLNFTKTAEYRKEFIAATSSAKKFCQQYKKEHPTETNLAIISDIDETILDNREHFRSHPEKNWELFDEWVKEAKAPVLKPTYEFLNWARKNGFVIFFITGRPEEDRKATIINLVRDGIDYDGLYLRPKHDGPPAEEFKTAVRQDIEKMGFKIVCSIGDQFSDLAGGSSLDCEKLPNKMYFIK
ncbi:MAG TPA: HAD family acid phosphatase [Drouetiella sp.]